MKMNNSYYETLPMTDLNLAVTCLTLGHQILRIEKLTPNKVQFIFKKSPELENLIEAYWNNALKVSPLEFADNLKSTKSRIYSN